MSWGKTSVLDETKKRLPDQIGVNDLNSFSIRCGAVTEFGDYVEVELNTPLGVMMGIAGSRFRVEDLRYHLPKTVATLAIDENCTLYPTLLTRQLGPDRPLIGTRIQATRILFRDSGYGNDVTLTWQPRSDMFSDDCWLVEQVPYEKPKLNFLVDETMVDAVLSDEAVKITNKLRSLMGQSNTKILLDTKAGKP